ncbi:hypothetical protein LCGC14_0837560 [marine sediment metagenome]|uniref:Uncharacterized protein n=2 Tax=marine sediment metagenome TaxID=412755 RepID=A0A0F9PIQ8_9ZZZZ
MEIEIASVGRAFLYLGIPFVLMIFYFQWHWARACDRNIQLLIAQESGAGVYELVPKSGGHVTLPYRDGTTRIWPVNELATIEVTYPGVGFVPSFLQKKIRQAVVNEGDWEPMLNRSPHRTKVASPDVVDFMLQLVADGHAQADEITAFLKGVSTGPTRELIGDPAMLGSLMQSGVMQALAQVSDDLMEALKGVRGQLARVAGINSVYVYGGLGLIIVLVGFVIYQQMQGVTTAPVTVDNSAIITELNIVRNAIMDKLAAVEGLIMEGLAELP